MATNMGCFGANLPTSYLRSLTEEGSPGFKHLGQCRLCFLHSIIPLYRIHNSKAYGKERLLCHLSSVIRALQGVRCHMVWEKGSYVLQSHLGPTEGLRLAAVRIQVYRPFLAAGTPRHALLSRYLGFRLSLSFCSLHISCADLISPSRVSKNVALLISAYKQWVWAGDSQASALMCVARSTD